MYLTSPLYDIGKIGIPDCILIKNGSLNDNEFNIMKTHTTIGYNEDTLKKDVKADYMTMSADIAHYHHEKYNGTGYPDGLKEEKIPLCARIIALADVYDALVSKRVYKSAFTHEVAKNIIVNDRRTHFDPVIVDAFLKCESELMKIHYEFFKL